MPRDDKELVGLVYSLTPHTVEDHLTWYKKPVALGVVVLLMTLGPEPRLPTESAWLSLDK